MNRPSPRIITTLLLVLLAWTSTVSAQALDQVRRWRAEHERDIVRELMSLVANPNVASSKPDILKNVPPIVAAFERRGFQVQTVETPGSPVILARRDAQPSRGVLTIYIHYDGQPVDPKEWTHGGPFTPVLELHGHAVPIDGTGPLDPESRLYGRSTSDDKGPIVALLSAVDALAASHVTIPWSLRVVLDGEEEAGSPNFAAALTTHAADVRGDVAVMVDGPRHPSGRATVYFGVRGGAGTLITVYGAKTDLHSGNYGNWGPDPAMRLAKLLGSMKDDTGRVAIDGFYDDVVPLTEEERAALADAPNVEQALKQQFLVAAPEQPDRRLEEKLNIPTLTITGLESGTVRGQGRTVINGTASARLDIRLVNGIDPEKQFQRVVAHVRKQGYYVIDRDPTDEERLAHPLIAKVTHRGGSRAPRTALDDPMARMVVRAIAASSNAPIVRLPTLGGSMPYSTFSQALRLPTVGLSIANFDNNQHGPDENLRIGNLWEGVDVFASLLQMAK